MGGVHFLGKVIEKPEINNNFINDIEHYGMTLINYLIMIALILLALLLVLWAIAFSYMILHRITYKIIPKISKLKKSNKKGKGYNLCMITKNTAK